MPTEVTAEDIQQMREQGDLGSYIRSLMTGAESRREVHQPTGQREFPAVGPPRSRPDGRPVGLWPGGCGWPGDPFPRLPGGS